MADSISFSLSLAQGNLILEALVERPFKEVFETIGHLNQQAAASFPEGSDEDDIGTIRVSPGQLRLILSVLGEMPYKRVNGLLRSMHQQMQEAKESDQ